MSRHAYRARPRPSFITRIRSTSALAGLLVVAMIAGVITSSILLPSSARAEDTPTVSLSLSDDAVLAGENAAFDFSVSNTSTEDWFNVGISMTVPNGIGFVSSSEFGAPTVYASGQTPPGAADAVAAGTQLWVWQDVSDLPFGASRAGDLTVSIAQPTVGFGETTDADVFPVGSEFDIETTAHASVDARLLPVFDGSTGVASAAATEATRSGDPLTSNASVDAVRLTKSEPSPESELMRGIHDRTTIYELVVENTSEGLTDNAVVVDYLPAGLEFLGCGSVDNTSNGAVEYENAASLTATPAVPECVEAASVETIEYSAGDSGYPAGLAEGVYTKVTWDRGTLPQGDPATGAASETVIRYAAGIPRAENTMSWSDKEPGSTGEQTANLDNNSGASTRHSTGSSEHTDGTAYTNVATAMGDYAGVVRTGSGRATGDTDDETVTAMDLRVLKSVDAAPVDGEPTPYGADTSDMFTSNDVAKNTLTLTTSEYTDASDIVLYDVVPDGLCPILPTDVTVLTGAVAVPDTAGGSTEYTGVPLADWPAACAPGPVGGGSWTDPQITGADTVAVAYDPTQHVFILRFAVADMTADAAGSEHSVVYPVTMRSSYQSEDGATSSGDGFTNTVSMTATTTTIDALGEPVTETVADDSEATIYSAFSSISKKVLPSSTPVTVAGSDTCATTGYSDELEGGFVRGDAVCYELSVDFAEGIDVRNPVITDMLPDGLTFEAGSASAALSGADIADVDLGFTRDGNRLTWAPATSTSGGDRFMPQGTTLTLRFAATVTGLSADASTLDKPQNLMKYRQENVDGEISFLRDAAEIEVESGVQLVKGVQSVNGDSTRAAQSSDAGDGDDFASNRDGIEVVHDDEVLFRIDLSDAPRDVTAMTVTDTLPVGIAESDVTDSGGGTLTTQPDGRVVITWSNLSIGDGAEKSLTYTVTIPERASVDETLVNTAAISSYAYETNTGDTPELIPGDDGVPAEGTSDDSSVYLPGASIEKSVVTTEIDNTNNSETTEDGTAPQAAGGELITYSYSVTVPANTTVYNGVLSDLGQLSTSSNMSGGQPYTVESAEITDFGPFANAEQMTTTEGFAFDATGALTFPGGSGGYTTGSTDETFSVTIVVYTTDDWADGDDLSNRAEFTHSVQGDERTIDDDAVVEYVDPQPVVSKTVNGLDADELKPGETANYVITVTNPSDRPATYDAVVADCVPAGLATVTLGAATQGTAAIDSAACADGGTGITWSIGTMEPGAVLTLEYTATVSEGSSAAASYVNTAALTGSTIPNTGRRKPVTQTDDTATVTVPSPGIEKSVDTDRAPVGETVSYTVTATLPALTTFFDTHITDVPATGIAIDESTYTFDCVGDGCANVPDEATPEAPTDGGIVWSLDTVTSSPEVRVITITYDATITDADSAAASRTNTASILWTTIDGDPDSQKSDSDTATVDVVDPNLVITKVVSDEAPNPGETFDYTLTVANTGDVTAHNVQVSDTVPDGVVVDSSTISPAGTLTGSTATGGGEITWNLDNPLDSGEASAVQLTYSAVLADSSTIADDENFTNTARVDSYTSFPDDGRKYGPTDDATSTVDPVFPNVAPVKTVTGTDTAYIGTPFSWTLTLTNTGDGPAKTVTARDTLPTNWEYTATESITVAGQAWVGSIEPTVDAGELTWTFESSDGTSVLEPGQVIEIVFLSTPTTQAATDAGAGSTIAHTNTVSAGATDTSDADGNESGPYSDPDDTADAHIDAADLQLTKTGAEAPIVAGTSGTGWTIDVQNAGPDTAVAPISVTDTTAALPDGLVVTEASGDGWTCDVPTRADDGVTTFDCERTSGALSLASGESFPSITVGVSVASTVLPQTVTNAASVTGKTYDPEPENNDDEAPLEVTTSADLAIAKTTATTSPHAGEPISWNIVVDNSGPSASQPSVTVTDVVPAGVSGVVATGADWTCDAPADAPAHAGETLTCEYTGTDGVLGVGQAGPIMVSGTVDSGFTGSIENTAVVHPGDTPDPEEPNNTTTTPPVAPSTETALAIVKTLTSPEAGPITPGETATYRITVTTTGTADARNVVVVDDVPAGLTFDSMATVDDAPWTCANQGDDSIRCALGEALLAGNDASLDLTFKLASDITTDVVNVATASADNADPVDDDATGAPEGLSDLQVEKNHPAGVVNAGTSLDYTLVVSNNGPSDTSNTPEPITLTDTVPAGMTPTDASGAGWQCTIDDQAADGTTLVECELTDSSATLAAGDSLAPVTVTVDIDAALAAQTLVNTAVVDGPQDDPDESNNTDRDPTDVTTYAQMVIDKQVTGAQPYVAGTTVDYEISVTNNGPSVGSDVRVADLVPEGMTVTELSGDDWTCDADAAACARDAHPIGAAASSIISVTVALDQSVPTDSELTNTATLGWTDSRGEHGDDDDETITTTAIADLVIVKTAVNSDGTEVTDAVAGEQLSYRVEVENRGPSQAVGQITVTDVLPAGTTFVGITDSSAWTCEPTSADDGLQSVDCDFADGALAAGQSAPAFTMIVQLAPDLSEGNLVNTAVVTTPTTESNDDNNSDDATVTVSQTVNLSIVKSHEGLVHIGNALTFSLAVHNDGPSTATAVRVSDALPTGLEFVEAASADDAWECEATSDDSEATSVDCGLIDSLAPGESAPLITVTVTVLASAYPGVVNTATVTADQPESDDSDNVSEDAVEVPPLATLVVTKTAAGDFSEGQNGVYEITVTNEGPTENPAAITVTDALPNGLTVANVSGDGAVCQTSMVTLSCEFPEGLGVGKTVSLTLEVAVGAGAFPSVTNVANVTTETEQTSDASLRDSETTSVTKAPVALPWTGASGWLSLLLVALALLIGGLALIIRRVRRA